MKIIKYLIYTLALVLLVSCAKHEILFNTEEVDGQTAEFQLHYFEPIKNEAAYYIDSVYVNNTLYSSVKGSGQLLPYNGVPGGATGRFFSVKSGEVNFKFYRKDKVVYDFNTTLKPGKQNVFVHDMTKAPVVVDNQFPYNKIPNRPSDPLTFNTDSIASVMFCNFMYEDATTPYKGKIQYQWKDPRSTTAEPVWYNIGEPVAFGETSTRTVIKVFKDVFNSQGSCRIDYRILDESGKVLQIMNSAGKMIDYSDWWTTTIGRSYMHIFRGIRTSKSLTVGVTVWTSL